jgi:hypothetical protein
MIKIVAGLAGAESAPARDRTGQPTGENHQPQNAILSKFETPRRSRGGSVGEWLSLVEHLVRDQGVGGSNPLSPTNSKALIGTHSGRNWAQLRESEAQSYPLCRHCTKHPVYLYPGTSVAL